MRAPRSRLGSREIQSQFSKREQPGSDARYKKFAKSHEHPSSIANHSRGVDYALAEDLLGVRFRGPLRTRKLWLARILYGLTFPDYEPVMRGANWVFSELPQRMSQFHRAKGQRTVGTVRFLRGWKCQARLPSG